MKDYKEFKVTPEILDLFRNGKVQARTVKQLISNYMVYQINNTKLVDENI